MKQRFGLVWALVAATACGTADAPAAATAEQPLTAVVAAVTKRLPWNVAHGPTLRPAGVEHAALGPSALSVDDHGQPRVLDNWGARVLDGDGALVATLAADSDDLVGYADGGFAVYRPLSRSVDVHGPRGLRIGTLQVPRAIVDVGLLEAGPSRRVVVTNPFQESVLLGSPSVPLDEASVLRSRHDGVFGDLEVIVDAGHAVLRVIVSGESKRVARAWPLGEARAARIVGREGELACVRLEHVADGAPIAVRREAVCLDLQSGRTRLRTPLPAPGLYVPRRELALGGGRLWLLHPEPAALALYGWEVQR